MQKNINFIHDFDSISFFRRLTECNRLANEYDFRFAVVSGLEGFEDALHQFQDLNALVAVDDTSQGDIDITNTPHKKSFRTVYLFMRHSIEENWQENRQRCFEVMRELFRQFATVLIRERTRLRLDNVIIGDRITFNEIDRYFFLNGACAFFQIEVDKFVSLVLDESEWLKNPIPPRMSNLDVNTPRHSTQHSSESGRREC